MNARTGGSAHGLQQGDFLIPATIRHPAEGLGPRAQRTIARIIEATRDVFLTRGYSGTTIDEIARAASVSRASFYTYFPSKREVLLAVGARSAAEAQEAIERLAQQATTRAGLMRWVDGYFAFLDVNGSFAFAWTQAAHEDEEIRTAGMKRHLELCKRMGSLLAESAGRQATNPVELGLVAFSALERAWSYCALYADTVDRTVVTAQIGQTLWGAARQPGTSSEPRRAPTSR
jgi:TetR/AcrR family transcriptional regulator